MVIRDRRTPPMSQTDRCDKVGAAFSSDPAEVCLLWASALRCVALRYAAVLCALLCSALDFYLSRRSLQFFPSTSLPSFWC